MRYRALRLSVMIVWGPWNSGVFRIVIAACIAASSPYKTVCRLEGFVGMRRVWDSPEEGCTTAPVMLLPTLLASVYMSDSGERNRFVVWVVWARSCLRQVVGVYVLRIYPAVAGNCAAVCVTVYLCVVGGGFALI